MAANYQVAIWEWQNSSGKWTSYSAKVSTLLENGYTRKLSVVCLGDVDENLKNYSVSLKHFQQISGDSGLTCKVQRKLCPGDAAPGNGVIWQWYLDQSAWCNFEADATQLIEQKFSQGEETLNLKDFFYDLNYKIDFRSMAQENNFSKFIRPIRRTAGDQYPRVKSRRKATGVSNSEADDGTKQIQTRSRRKKAKPQQVTMEASSQDSGILGVFERLGSAVKDFLPGLNSHVGNSSSGDESELSSGTKRKGQKPKIRKGKAKTKHHQAVSLPFPTSVFLPPSVIGNHLRILPVLGIAPPKSEDEIFSQIVACSAFELLSKYTTEVQETVLEDCSICFESMENASPYDGNNKIVKLNRCSHCYHCSCLVAMCDSGNTKGYIQCPICKVIYGVKTGNRPRGKMEFLILPIPLPGHPDCATIQITYTIFHGIQGPEHPHPGRQFLATGFPRCGYLPDNEDGRKVLQLLITAWERRLTFTVGQSTTTGRDDRVTWNEIHHKTEFGTNYSGHGYPDSHYLSNVLMELAMQGVTED